MRSWDLSVSEYNDQNTCMSLSLFTLSELMLNCSLSLQRDGATGITDLAVFMPTVWNDLLSELRDTDISRPQFKARLRLQAWLVEHAYS